MFDSKYTSYYYDFGLKQHYLIVVAKIILFD